MLASVRYLVAQARTLDPRTALHGLSLRDRGPPSAHRDCQAAARGLNRAHDPGRHQQIGVIKDTWARRMMVYPLAWVSEIRTPRIRGWSARRPRCVFRNPNFVGAGQTTDSCSLVYRVTAEPGGSRRRCGPQPGRPPYSLRREGPVSSVGKPRAHRLPPESVPGQISREVDTFPAS